MTECGSVLELARAAESVLDRNRARIDDLNVYPVPDGDTGTNMLLTVRAVREALEAGKTDIAHAALLVIVAALFAVGVQTTRAQQTDAQIEKRLASAQHKATVDGDLDDLIHAFLVFRKTGKTASDKDEPLD